MKRAWLLAALALLPAQANSLTMQCNSYVGRNYPGIKLEEYQKSYVVSWEGFTETYNKSITKHFGVLMDGGVHDTDNTEEHIFLHDDMSGVNVIILDSMIFIPVCPK
jgi:hypothetical protein